MPQIIRTMTLCEVDLAIDWAAKEGWNPGIHDAECFFAADSGGFLVEEMDGEPVATISVVQYGDDYGFLGFYIVKPEFRGRALGFPILMAGLKRLGARNIGLDGVVEQQRNYIRIGFKMAYNNIRYEGVRDAESSSPDPAIVPLRKVPFDQLCDYDCKYFFTRREAFLKPWIAQPQTTALGYVVEGVLQGYGVIRKCRKGYKIGPLFGDTDEIARALFARLIGVLEQGETFYLDIPEPNSDAKKLVVDYKMQKVFETARMYTGPAPDLPLERIYGVTSFELG